MSSRPPRPFGVKAIVALLLVASVIDLTSGVANILVILQGGGSIGLLPTLPALRQLAMLVLPLALGSARLVAAVGLLRLQRWAWVLVMLITGGQLAADLWQYVAAGDRPYEGMLLNVAVVFYLNQGEVQRTFGQRVAHYRLLHAPVQEAP
jgi:hypothetical protein